MARGITFAVAMPREVPFAKAKARAEHPLREKAVVEQIVRIMRRGKGSAEDQFQRSRELTPAGGYRNWAPTRAFGTRPAPQSTLVRDEAYMNAWTGLGPGSTSDSDDFSVTIGVDQKRFPQVTMLQADAPRSVRVTIAMRVYLWHNLKVWLGQSVKRIFIPPRRVNVGQAAINRAEAVLSRYVATGSTINVAAGDRLT